MLHIKAAKQQQGIVLNEPIGARHISKSFPIFVALWKDADPDIPILKEAKAEYAKLQ